MNVSASKVKDLIKCSYAFYCKNVLKLPEETHEKTLAGSCLHYIIEFVLKPRRKQLRLKIIKDGFTFGSHPSIYRYVEIFHRKHEIDMWQPMDLEPLLQLAFSTIAPYIKEDNFKSEQRFELKIGDATCSGIVDLTYIDKENSRIMDFKTSAQKFTKKEMMNNIQAPIYQLWYFETYGELVEVDFIMVRHPPTKFKPQKHIQTAKAPSEDILEGLKYYVRGLYQTMNNFGLREAFSSFCDDYWFCEKLCKFKEPFEYATVFEGDKEIGNFHLDKIPQLKENQTVKIYKYNGCPKFNA